MVALPLLGRMRLSRGRKTTLFLLIVLVLGLIHVSFANENGEAAVEEEQAVPPAAADHHIHISYCVS